MLNKAAAVLKLYNIHRKEIGVLEAAELLNRPKSTVSRWLSGMEDAGFLRRDEVSGRYRVSLWLAAIGEMAKQATSLQQAAYPVLERLTTATDETSNLVLPDGGEATNVEAVESSRPVIGLGEVGRRFPLHASAAGKALIAWRSESEIRTLMPTTLDERTSLTITDIDALLEDLAETRDRGYAVNWRELEDDLVGIGAPVRNHLGMVVAAVSISAPAFRVSPERRPRLGRSVAEAADMLSEILGYRGPPLVDKEEKDADGELSVSLPGT